MCPFCFGLLGLVVGGTISSSTLAALAMKICRQKNETAEPISSTNTGSNENDTPHGRQPESSLA